jgi:hypothetical protein
MGFKHRSNNDGRFSDAIWGDLPEEIKYDPAVGIYRSEDFASFGLTTAVSSGTGRYVGRGGVYKSHEDGGSISQLPTALGRLAIVTGGTDNHDSWLQSCAGTGVLGKVSSASPRKLWFEARVAVAQLVTHNLLVGLSEEGQTAGDAVTDAGALADKDFLGFQVLEDAPTKVDIVFRKAGQAAVEVLSEAHTLVADTFVNLGFVFDPGVGVAQRIRFYVNGVKQSNYVTAAQIAGATFPNGEELAFLIGGKNGTGSARTFYCEGWQFAQLF